MTFVTILSMVLCGILAYFYGRRWWWWVFFAAFFHFWVLLILVVCGPLRIYGPGHTTAQKGQPRWGMDPYYRHEYRWWNGQEWTNRVMDDDVISTDQFGAKKDIR